jgi:outer membrane protein assembly factor BamB
VRGSRGISETAGAVIVILTTVVVMLLLTYHLGVLGESAPRLRGALSLRLASRGGEVWSFGTQGEIHSSPRTDGERIYFGSNDGRLYALSFQGRHLWSFPARGPVVSSPVLWGELVCSGSTEGTIYALERSTGRERWRFQTEGWVVSPPLLWENLLVVPAYSLQEGLLYALRMENGEAVWRLPLDSPLTLCLALWENILYAGTLGGTLYAIEVEGGALLWQKENFLFPFTSPLSVWGERLYLVPGDTPFLFCLSAENGEVLWYSYLTNPSYSPPLVEGGRVYVGDEAGVLHCLSAENGEELWRRVLGGSLVSSPTLHENRLYVGSRDNGIYCLNAENGEPQWRFFTGGPITSTPLLLGERLYVGSSDNRLHCLNLGEELLVIRWRGEEMKDALVLENGRVEWRNLRLRADRKRVQTSWASLNGDPNPGLVSLSDGDLLELRPSPPLTEGSFLVAAYAPADQLLGAWRVGKAS